MGWVEDLSRDETETTRFDENRNYLETHPQICTVIKGNGRWRKGDEIFVHYMAYETAAFSVTGLDDAVIIDADFVFFRILASGEFEMAEDTYLGEAVINGDAVTASGIVFDLGKRDSLRVRITHVPADARLSVGDVVFSVDKNNYEFNYREGQRYIKLKTDEIGALCQ